MAGHYNLIEEYVPTGTEVLRGCVGSVGRVGVHRCRSEAITHLVRYRVREGIWGRTRTRRMPLCNACAAAMAHRLGISAPRAIRFIECDACGARGAADGVRCAACRGTGRFAVEVEQLGGMTVETSALKGLR